MSSVCGNCVKYGKVIDGKVLIPCENHLVQMDHRDQIYHIMDLLKTQHEKIDLLEKVVEEQNSKIDGLEKISEKVKKIGSTLDTVQTNIASQKQDYELLNYSYGQTGHRIIKTDERVSSLEKVFEELKKKVSDEEGDLERLYDNVDKLEKLSDKSFDESDAALLIECAIIDISPLEEGWSYYWCEKNESIMYYHQKGDYPKTSSRNDAMSLRTKRMY